MKSRAFALLLAIVPVVSVAMTQPAFDDSFELLGITFHVLAPNDGSSPGLTITPSGLEIVNTAIEHDIDGVVYGVELADLNVDQSPEIYVYVRSGGPGAKVSLIAYAANNRKSLSEIYLPPVTRNPEASKGYRGHDELGVVESSLLQRFPIYRDGDEDGKPTGGTRQLQYKLGPGEAGWVLTLDKISEF